MRPIKFDFSKDLDYDKIISIQRKFEDEGSSLGSENLKKCWRLVIDLDKSNIIQNAIQNGDIIDNG